MSRMLGLDRLLFSLVVVIGLTSQSSAGNAQELLGFKRQGVPVTLQQIAPGKLRTDLQSLSPAAAQTALQMLGRMEFPMEDAVRYIRADASGAIFYEDSFNISEPGHKHDTPNGDPLRPNAVISISPSAVFSLHSKPGASRVVYLNFKGEVVTGKQWNALSGISSHPMKAFSLDGNLASVTQAEADLIAEVWKNVSEDYAAFDIDVTTERPASFGPQVGHILISPRMDSNGNYIYSSPAGGVAYVDV